MANEPLLILGTHNAKKGRELIELFESLPVHTKTLADCDQALHVVEDGDSFEENAIKKACQQAIHLDAWVLGEDSGLCVDALNGQPGIYSARFAGAEASDPENNHLLLERMAAVPTEQRGAHYVCHAVLSDPSGNIRGSATGKCHGVIRREEVGKHGFGYDPLFEIREYHRTFGELGPQLKSSISHRARSIAQLIPQIKPLIYQGRWTTE